VGADLPGAGGRAAWQGGHPVGRAKGEATRRSQYVGLPSGLSENQIARIGRHQAPPLPLLRGMVQTGKRGPIFLEIKATGSNKARGTFGDYFVSRYNL